jgi:hypothetical protein
MDSSRAVRSLVVLALWVFAATDLVLADEAAKYSLQGARRAGELTHVDVA